MISKLKSQNYHNKSILFFQIIFYLINQKGSRKYLWCHFIRTIILWLYSSNLKWTAIDEMVIRGYTEVCKQSNVDPNIDGLYFFKRLADVEMNGPFSLYSTNNGSIESSQVNPMTAIRSIVSIECAIEWDQAVIFVKVNSRRWKTAFWADYDSKFTIHNKSFIEISDSFWLWFWVQPHETYLLEPSNVLTLTHKRIQF